MGVTGVAPPQGRPEGARAVGRTGIIGDFIRPRELMTEYPFALLHRRRLANSGDPSR